MTGDTGDVGLRSEEGDDIPQVHHPAALGQRHINLNDCLSEAKGRGEKDLQTWKDKGGSEIVNRR